MPVLKSTEYELIDPGYYRAKVLSIEEREGVSQQTGEPNTYLRWTFTVTEPGHEGSELTANSSLKFSAQANARKWSQAILGRKIPDSEAMDTDDLVGREAVLEVGHEKKGDRTYTKIESITRLSS